MRYVVFLLLVGVAEAQKPPSSYKPFAALADLMSGILFPNSNFIFDVTVPKKAPKSDADWIAVQTSAAVLAEAGNLLLLRGRRKENGQPVPQTADWRKHVQVLVEAAKGAHKLCSWPASRCTKPALAATRHIASVRHARRRPLRLDSYLVCSLRKVIVLDQESDVAAGLPAKS